MMTYLREHLQKVHHLKYFFFIIIATENGMRVRGLKHDTFCEGKLETCFDLWMHSAELAHYHVAFIVVWTQHTGLFIKKSKLE